MPVAWHLLLITFVISHIQKIFWFLHLSLDFASPSQTMENSVQKILEIVASHGTPSPEQHLRRDAVMTELQIARNVLQQLCNGRPRDVAMAPESAMSELAFVSQGLVGRIWQTFSHSYANNDIGSRQKRESITKHVIDAILSRTRNQTYLHSL